MHSRNIRGAAVLVLTSWLTACGGNGTADEAMPDADATQDAQDATGAGAARAVPGDAPPTNGAWVIFTTDEGAADTVVAEVAATPEERERGLMHRQELPDGTGMLFVFQDSEERSFWMANTFVPLDIAYMDEDYAIVSILAMRPLDRSLYPSGAPAMYALEVPQGWFEAHGIGVGATPQVEYGPKLGG